MFEGLRLAITTFTALPVPASDRTPQKPGSAMAWGPLIGAVLGGLAGSALWLANAIDLGQTVAAVAAVAALAALTRGLHLDGLADTADALGSAAPAEEALRIMKSPDIGPFGVVTLVLTLLAQVAALQQLRWPEALAALIVAAAAGRLAVTWACRPGIAAARAGGLGAFVAGSVPPALVTVATVGTAVGAAGLAQLTGADPLRAVFAVAAGLLTAHVLLTHCRSRLGGITGDVLGALVETATTAALLVFATG